MTISRGKRVLGLFINMITLNGLLLGNLILLLTSGKTIGGMVAGYKYDTAGPQLVVLLVTNILSAILYMITLGIFWIVDISTMQNRDGTFAEQWASIKKVEA